MTVTREHLYDFMRGECNPAEALVVTSLLNRSDSIGDATRAELAKLERLVGLFDGLPELEVGVELEARLGRELSGSFDGRAQDLDTPPKFAGIPEMRVSTALVKRIDKSLYAATIEADSPILTTLVRLMVEGGPEAPQKVAALIAHLPLLRSQRDEIASLLKATSNAAPPDAARSARRISERLRAVLAAEPKSVDRIPASLKLPELTVPSGLEDRIQASLSAARLGSLDEEMASGGEHDSPRRSHRFSLAEWRARRNLPSLSRTRGLAIATMMHCVMLAALFFVVSTTRAEQPLPTARISTESVVFPMDPDPMEGYEDRTPAAIRSVVAGPVSISGPIVEAVPAEFARMPWELEADLMPELGETLTRAKDDMETTTLLERHGRGEALIPVKNRAVPADIGEGEVLFSWRRRSRLLKQTLLPDEMAWLLRLDEAIGYLRRAQLEDGSYGGGIDDDIPRVSISGEWDVAARKAENTALALLALTGDGYGGLADTPEKTVTRAANWLIANQNVNGGFVSVVRDGVSRAQDTILTDAICTLALAEAWALDGDTSLRDAMRRGLNRLVQSQIGMDKGPAPAHASDKGGWAAGSGGRADPVTTAWVVQALLTGKALKWRDPALEAVLANAKEWVRAQVSLADGASSEGFVGVAVRPSADPAVRQTGERSVGSATASLMTVAALLKVVDPAVEESQRQFLTRERYMPNLAAFGPPGERFYPTNLTGWCMTMLAFHDGGVDATEMAWVKHFGHTMFAPGSPWETAGKNLGSLAPRGEEEDLRGRVFTAAMTAIAIENTWRWRVSRR